MKKHEQIEAIKKRLQEYQKDEKKGAKEYQGEKKKIPVAKEMFEDMARDERSHRAKINQLKKKI